MTISEFQHMTIVLASNQALPSRIITYACKEEENLEDFDHVLDLVGCGYQLVVTVVHAVPLI